MSESISTTGAPPPELPGGSEEHQGNPWERRAELGASKGFLEALKLFIVSPGEAFAQTRCQGDYGSPLLFAIVLGWVGVLIGKVWELLFGVSVLSAFPLEMREQLPFLVGGSTFGLVLTLVLAPIYILVALFIWSALLHLCLVLVGGLKQSKAGFEGTFRVVSYATVAQLGSLIPVFGSVVTLVWTIVLGVVGITSLHKSSQGQAIAALLIPLALCCLCVMLFMMSIGAGLLAAFAAQG
ncbi:MAG: hypothetical protein GWP16_03345 [Nitrospirae bacterium]|nr:hypothetical protein [Nitrospirota bacterium]